MFSYFQFWTNDKPLKRKSIPDNANVCDIFGQMDYDEDFPPLQSLKTIKRKQQLSASSKQTKKQKYEIISTQEPVKKIEVKGKDKEEKKIPHLSAWTLVYCLLRI